MFDVLIRYFDEAPHAVYDTHNAYEIRSMASGANIIRRTRTKQQQFLFFGVLVRDQGYLRQSGFSVFWFSDFLGYWFVTIPIRDDDGDLNLKRILCSFLSVSCYLA